MITGIWVEKPENENDVQVVVTKGELLEYQRAIDLLIKENKELWEIIHRLEQSINYLNKGAKQK